MVIARNRALAVHHVTVQDIGGRLSVSLDLELDGKLSLAQAHEVADGLEDSIAAELGPEVEVETHIEPLQPGRTRGPRGAAGAHPRRRNRACGNRRRRRVQCATFTTSACGKPMKGKSSTSTAVSIPGSACATVHEKVDQVERALKLKSPQVARVIGHAEPAA